MKILAIGAHPDDIEVGCAGTLLKYAQRGHELYLMVMTEGDKGGDARIRRREQIGSSGILGVKDLIWGRFKDTQLTPHMNDMVLDIENALNKVKPDFTFVNFGFDTHQDHRALYNATVSATRYIKNVIFYEVPTTQNFSPTLFVDIKDTIDDKIAILLTHNSQVMKTNIEGLTIADVARSTAIFRGIQGRVQYAEGFVPLRVFVNM